MSLRGRRELINRIYLSVTYMKITTEHLFPVSAVEYQGLIPTTENGKIKITKTHIPPTLFRR